ncbi:MAG: response regulator [Anaerolineales bacterium]|nr:response regulator [Anaerolineales bacterium]
MNPPASQSEETVRILVVDDHPNTAATLARALSQLGPHVEAISAVNGAEAFEKVKDKAVDIIFTDMIMPEMTGLELIEKLQNHPGGRPSYAYLITAYDVPGLKVSAQRLKVNEVIIKPARPEKICQIAETAIGELKHAANPTGKKSSAKRKFKILVADDVMDNVTLLTRYLEYEGYDQVIARDGQEALNKIRDEMPDLILLDVNMPNKDGFTVLEEVRSDYAIAHIPIIILTAARLDPSDVQSGLNLGADDYVTKPFDRHELMARIRTKLRVKEAEDATRRRNRELNLLPEISKQLSARLDTKELADVLLKRTAETLGAAQANMCLLDDEKGIVEKCKVVLSQAGENIDLAPPTQLIQHVRDTRQGLVIDDAINDPLLLANARAAIRSAIVAPIFGRHSLLGIISLFHEQEGYFTNEHLSLLQAIAGQAAIAIENARLYSTVLQEQKKVAVVVKHATEAILLFDEQENLTLLNPAGEKLFPPHSIKLNHPLPAEQGYDDLLKLIESARASQMSATSELRWADQREFTAFISPTENGGTVVILHDVSRFKDLERVKNEFIATASHDLRNPLTSVKGYAQMLFQAGPLNGRQKEFVEHIENAVKSMSELIQNMMDLAKTDLDAAQKHETLDLGKILSEVVNEFAPQAKSRNQSLRYTPPAAPVQIYGDALRLRQAFRNLLGNAIKYTPQGGIIQASLSADKNKATVLFKDNGYGIPAADLPFIFNRFYRIRSGKTADIEGSGLGLAIVKAAIVEHGGSINVESEVGKGASFSVSLPFVKTEIQTEVSQ